jgi:23S rRNA G2069 N7-methylase RlmK/C1962 C5-methylase RlmI
MEAGLRFRLTKPRPVKTGRWRGALHVGQLVGKNVDHLGVDPLELFAYTGKK